MTDPGAWKIDQKLLDLADTWRTYLSQTEIRRCSMIDGQLAFDDHESTIPIIRCAACDERILPEDSFGRLHHLMLSHGYRMNGLQYDNHNRVIGHA